MSNTIIKVEGIGKQYNIGALHKQQQHDTLRDKIAAGFKSTKKHLIHRKSTMLGTEEFWALRDVSFEVKQGEVLGIIGKNGAGKSTLLKILCRVTSPTEGRATLKGRIGTLLEVGTGFHQELTGRENIYLSGAILGMDKAYIERKLDEIIAFSGIEKFIDTPVKRYSSGMRVRLGFAVAAHLEPEILLIDEVLAVGDLGFQKKCLGKMKDISSQGRTVLFVSHDMGRIGKLCSSALFIENGKLVIKGNPDSIIKTYTNTCFVNNESGENNESITINSEYVSIVEVTSSNNSGSIYTGSSLNIGIVLDFHKIVINPGIVVSIRTQLMTELIRFSTYPISDYSTGECIGKRRFDLTIPEILLSAGEYIIAVGVSKPNIEFLLPLNNVAKLMVQENDFYKTGHCPTVNKGFLALRHKWTMVDIE